MTKPNGDGSGWAEQRVVVVAAAHLPPPVHGMAVAADILVKRFAEAAARVGGRVVRADISSDRRRRGLGHHASRCWRVCAAARKVCRHRQEDPTIYVSCDAGLGMIYTVILATAARLCGLRCYVHHHSYAYLHRRSLLFVILSWWSGKEAVHLVGCDGMALALAGRYSRVRRVRVLPILYAVQGASEMPLRQRAGSPVVLGHLSNLSREKGLVDVFETVEQLHALGVSCRLRLAGPPATEEDATLLQELLQQTSGDVEYVGTVHGASREAFYSDTDFFLFPSRYRHESFGLVAGEALVRGVPLVAYEVGCLTKALVGDTGLMLPRECPFASPAARWIADRALGGARPMGFGHVRSAHEDAQERAQMVAREVVDSGRRTFTSTSGESVP